jgi:hypothetical protein
MNKHKSFFSKIEDELKVLRKKYLEENVPLHTVMESTATIAQKYQYEFENLRDEEKVEFSDTLAKWLNFEMEISDAFDIEEPLTLFNLALQFSGHLNTGVYISVVVQYTKTMLSKGLRRIYDRSYGSAFVQNIINNLNNVEDIARTAGDNALIAWIKERKDDLLAYY